MSRRVRETIHRDATGDGAPRAQAVAMHLSPLFRAASGARGFLRRRRRHPAQLIVIAFAAAILIGTALLMLRRR